MARQTECVFDVRLFESLVFLLLERTLLNLVVEHCLQ